MADDTVAPATVSGIRHDRLMIYSDLVGNCT